jgi:hypothetical protein
VKLPPFNERYEFYVEVMGKCTATRDERLRLYTVWRNFFLFGAGPETTENVVNKIWSHLDQLTSLMYSGETTRFSIDLSPSASDLHKTQISPLIRSLNDDWHLANADIVFGIALKWAFVYGSMFVKLRVNQGQIEPHVVEPFDIGVLREDIHGLWRQEAFCHSYYMSRSQFVYEMEQIPHPRLNQILKEIVSVPRPSQVATTATLDKIVTSASQPLVVGNVNFDLLSPNKYQPKVTEDLLQMHELYVFDDEEKDFRIVTIAEPGVVVFERPIKEVFIPGEQPIVQICPNPAHDYFWGYSEVDRLIPLQKMRNERMTQIKHLLNLQANPPSFGSGFQGTMDEIADTLDSPSGVVMADMPGAKLEKLTPEIPEDLYKEIRELDSMFEEMSGISNVMQGKGEMGVRSKGHAEQLARLGASRAKQRALIIEDSLEKIAMLFMQLKQAYDKSRLQTETGIQFVADQFTDKYIVKVDAHSNSPIFMEDQRALAFDLFKNKVISRESLLDLLDVPMKELLKHRLKEIEAAEKAQQQQEQQAHSAELAAKHASKVSPIRGGG